MKKIYLYLLTVLCSFHLNAQHSWSSIGDAPDATVNAITADTGSTFFIGGSFNVIGSDSMHKIARWGGDKFYKVGQKGITGSHVSSLIKYGDELIVGGTFSMADTISCNNIASWDGVRWNALDAGLDYTGATTVSTLTIYNGDLYAGGSFYTSGGDTLNNIARWNGSSWSSLGSGTNGTVKVLCVYDGELYAAGTFTNAGGISVKNIAKWDGTDWSDVDGGLEYTGATTVSTLQVYNDNLYAGGIFGSAGGDPAEHIAKWNGTSWSDVNGGLQYTGATTVSTLTISQFEGKLIAEAKYRSIADTTLFVYRMQYWNDTVWTMMDSKSNGPAYSLQVVNGSLFAGGDFTEIADDSVSFLAQWATSNERSVIQTGSETAEKEIISGVYPNPANDSFTITVTDDNYKGLYSGSFLLSDLMGREVMLMHDIQEGQKIYRDGIKAGVYIYRLKDAKGNTISRGKIIFE